jgi:hypothetical protein
LHPRDKDEVAGTRAHAPKSPPVLIAPGGLSVFTPLGDVDWAKPGVVAQASARPQTTKQRANINQTSLSGGPIV